MSKTCSKCGKTGLGWIQSNGKWKLSDGNKVHTCENAKASPPEQLKKPELDELPEGDETIFILQNKATKLYYTGWTTSTHNPKEAKQFFKLDLLNKKAVFEEAYIIVGYHSVI